MSGISVTVVHALPDAAIEIEVHLPEGATIGDAIERSGIHARLRHFELSTAAVGIFGKRARRDTILADGDRVELYRPLTADPKAARRRRAIYKRR
jgi:putative ubiquitin-RnfH superfamily antitoxin RatB of RatAB toxin-antitoxin module